MNPDPGIRDFYTDPPPAGSGGGSGSAITWSNPSRVTINDGSASTVTLPIGTSTSHYLKATNFGFSIPTNATILGVQVAINGKRSASQPSVGRVYLYKGSIQMNSVKFFGSQVATSNFSTGVFTTLTFGDSTDLWSDTVLTPADVNASTFGVALKMTAGRLDGTASVSSCDVSVDYITMTVYYAGGITIGADVAGSVTLTLGRIYTYAFRNPITGHVSDIAPFSNSTGAKTARNIPLSGIGVSTDPQVTRKVILATSDGGDLSTLYLLAEIDNATTTLTDDVAEIDLLSRDIFLETSDDGIEVGITDNTPPPGTTTLPTKHRGRLYMCSGQQLIFSKSLADVITSTGTVTSVYEEAWPANNYFDVSAGAEAPRALLSDGQILYIGTERAIHRLFGSGPEDFDEPDILFNDVGVLNQEVWIKCFLEGSPIGTCWLTPDNRVMASDFNSYKDIGYEVQATLNTINSTVAETVACGTFVAQPGLDLYILAIPTGSNVYCDTILVFDLRRKSWVTWTLTDQVTSLLAIVSSAGIPKVLIGASGTQKLYNFDTTTFKDRLDDSEVSFLATARTVWLDLGDMKGRKHINEVEVVSSDPFLQVKVEGATTSAEFTTPTVVKDTSFLSTSPFGDKKLYLASSITRDRYYRFTFSSAGDSQRFMDGFSSEIIPIHRL
jgi:hypothetical protein